MNLKRVIFIKTQRNIFIAFILNLGFSIFEFIGGLFAGSIAILSDSVHDLGDAVSIGISFALEKKSRKTADNNYTYGYIRFSVLGGLISTVILLVGSIFVIISSIKRIFHPVSIDYGKMIIFAIVGVVLNTLAAFVTREGDSINQKAVNLHMLEDVLGWIVVLIGSIVMKFTHLTIIDPIMSLCVSVFILYNAINNIKQIADLFLEKTPDDIDIDHLKEHLCRIEGVEDVHHIHIWSMDGYNHCATMHIVTQNEDIVKIKKEIRRELSEHGICHSVLETEYCRCEETECNSCFDNQCVHNHHHHHH